MTTLREVLLFVHLVGFAALFGGALVQARDAVRVVNVAMLYGALAQVVSGIFLVGVIEGAGDPIDHTKVAVKFAVGLVVAVLCWVNRSKPAVPHGLFTGILLLTLGDAAVAVFWS